MFRVYKANVINGINDTDFTKYIVVDPDEDRDIWAIAKEQFEEPNYYIGEVEDITDTEIGCGLAVDYLRDVILGNGARAIR